MVNKRILVTTIRDPIGNEREIYGRYDAVRLANLGFTVVDSKFVHCTMTEETFYNNAKKENKI